MMLPTWHRILQHKDAVEFPTANRPPYCDVSHDNVCVSILVYPVLDHYISPEVDFVVICSDWCRLIWYDVLPNVVVT